MDNILQNGIRTPDGTILVSSVVHEFRAYKDKKGETYLVDGGNF